MIPQINVIREIKQIVVQGTNNMANFLPFSVVATQNGQTQFTLPYCYTTIICLFIMGTGQDPITGDYTQSGNIVILGGTAPYIEIGDVIFGMGQL